MISLDRPFSYGGVTYMKEVPEDVAEEAGITEVDATDAAKELAEERGVDLQDVTGTGVDGRILKSDVEGYESE